MNIEQEKLEQVRNALLNEKFDDAKEILDGISEKSIEYFMLKGEIEQKFQNWGNAINAYNKVLEINKDNQDAKNHLFQIQSILDFFNTDLINP